MWFGCAATAGELVASLSSTGRGVRGAPGATTLGPLQSRPGRAGESRPAVSPQGQAWRASSWKQDLGEAPRWRAGFQSPPRFSLPLRDCRQGRRRLLGAHHAPGTALSATVLSRAAFPRPSEPGLSSVPLPWERHREGGRGLRPRCHAASWERAQPRHVTTPPGRGEFRPQPDLWSGLSLTAFRENVPLRPET